MVARRMFERAPFEKCPSCGSVTFGILSVGGSTLRRRCTKCRHARLSVLPELSKKVVYLDQFAISEIFKVKSGLRRPQAGAQVFWEDVTAQVNRTYLLQQVIFPGSNIHRHETIVARFGNDLALAHEMLSGDVSFVNFQDVELAQTLKYAEAYLRKTGAPSVSFDVDEILDGDRNDWLPDLHISANMDYGAFANEIRRHRDEMDANCARLWERWIAQKPTFNDVLSHEINDFGNAKRGALRHAAERAKDALEARCDTQEFLDQLSHPIMREFHQLKQFFKEAGIAESELASSVYGFWDWPENRTMPVNTISAYLFAGLARRLASGQKKLPSRGTMNDIRAISTYGPYVDAMFLDNECASLLSEEPLRSEINLTARIFSAKSGKAFLEYLRGFEAQTPDDVRRYAHEIYGI